MEPGTFLLCAKHMNCTMTVSSLISEPTCHANGNIHTDHTWSGPIETEKEKLCLKLHVLFCFQINSRWMEIFPERIALITFPRPSH